MGAGDQIESAITAAFTQTDQALYDEICEMYRVTPLERPLGAIGTTVAGILVHNRLAYLVNLGDSTAAILEKKRGILMQTAMHKPDLFAEHQRIALAGGWVSQATVVHVGPKVARQPARLNGVLAVSRSFGDWMFEQVFSGVDLPYPITDHDQAVVSKIPTIQSLPLSSIHGSGFLALLATDGLTDVQSLDQVYRFLTWHGETPDWRFEALGGFLKHVEKPDNTTVLIVVFEKEK